MYQSISDLSVGDDIVVNLNTDVISIIIKCFDDDKEEIQKWRHYHGNRL